MSKARCDSTTRGRTSTASIRQPIRGSVVDLFCGAGGLTHGFLLEGFTICAGIDIDEDCRYPFEQNNRAPFIRRDVTGLRSADILPLFEPDKPRILVGCAPCQPFSIYNQKNDDPKWQLLRDFGNLIINTSPDIVSMENVPRLLNFRDGTVFAEFVALLERERYRVSWKVVFAPDYGVPQRRSRLVLLASRLGEIELEAPCLIPSQYPTVRDAIGTLHPLQAGEIDRFDPLHRCCHLSETNLKRIRAARPGGSWKDWDQELVTDCHRVSTGRGYSSVYGRMVWDAPAPTITTQFHGFGNGRFGHPEQDRALSLREGTILQSFPPDYEFTAPGRTISFSNVSRIIGNAVPVLLAQAIARSIRTHLEECG
jgi:DNA (cytosine-5)-methyltransferase 1